MKKLSKILIITFVLSVTLYAGSAFAGIARDNHAVKQQAAATTLTLSYTVMGPNPILFVTIQGYNGASTDDMVGVTYNGVAMTKIDFVKADGNGYGAYLTNWLYALANPSVGTHDIIATESSANLGYLVAESFTGASQTSIATALTNGEIQHTTNSSGLVSGNSYIDTTLTTTVDKSWALLTEITHGDNNVSAGTNETAVFTDPNSPIYDTNGHGDITPAGSFTMRSNFSQPTHTVAWTFIMASFAPAVAPPPPTGVSSLMGLTGDINIAPTILGNDFSITTSASTIDFNLPSASASTRGLLTPSDWSTFNNKQASLGNLNGLVIGDGSGTYNAATTLSVGLGGTGTNTLSGLLKGNGTGPIQAAMGGTDYEFPLTFNSPLSRNINSISCLTASGSQAGCLSSSDWIVFNGKQNAILPGTGLTFSGSTLNSVWTITGNNIYNNNSGNVGIGTTAPGALLTVTGGDAFVSTQSKGVILRATNGPNCFRVTVNNIGRLKTTLVACP